MNVVTFTISHLFAGVSTNIGQPVATYRSKLPKLAFQRQSAPPQSEVSTIVQACHTNDLKRLRQPSQVLDRLRHARHANVGGLQDSIAGRFH